MTNEEIINKILQESSKLNVRHEVIELSNKILELNPKMEKVNAFELSFNHLTFELTPIGNTQKIPPPPENRIIKEGQEPRKPKNYK
jgi:hypothetical protein